MGAMMLKTRRLYLTESEMKIQEIGQRITPITSNFNFIQGSNGKEVSFEDSKGNKIKVMFYETEKPGVVEIDFMVNNTSFGNNVNMSTQTFFLIVSTVIECINIYLDKYDPKQIKIEGSDKIGKDGQKNKIWKQYLTVGIKDKNYKIGEESDGNLYLQKSDGGINLERTEKGKYKII